MNEEKSTLMEILGDAPVVRIIDFLLENKLFDYSKKQIIDETELSKVTFYKYWGVLVDSGIVEETRAFGKTRLYKINEKSLAVQKIKELEFELLEKAAPIAIVEKAVRKEKN
jgi:DNA-binding transcriptional ArsR family regulator